MSEASEGGGDAIYGRVEANDGRMLGNQIVTHAIMYELRLELGME
jgi:hypothetical protein